MLPWSIHLGCRHPEPFIYKPVNLLIAIYILWIQISILYRWPRLALSTPFDHFSLVHRFPMVQVFDALEGREKVKLREKSRSRRLAHSLISSRYAPIREQKPMYATFAGGLGTAPSVCTNHLMIHCTPTCSSPSHIGIHVATNITRNTNYARRRNSADKPVCYQFPRIQAGNCGFVASQANWKLSMSYEPESGSKYM